MMKKTVFQLERSNIELSPQFLSRSTTMNRKSLVIILFSGVSSGKEQNGSHSC